MASTLSQLSACVTRILALTGFPKELKTRDIQTAFSEWENANGGFKIKWINDTSLLIVFNDATVAKRAYLHTLAFPPPIFSSPTSAVTAIIKPYDGPDAQTVIQNVNARQHTSNGRGHNVRSSVSHARGVSVSANMRNPTNNPGSSSGNNPLAGLNGPNPSDLGLQRGIPGIEREQPSPTLPSLPSHPTLNALISSSLGGEVANSSDPTFNDPAILAAQPEHGAPRIGDPGKRMLGAALGMRHPGLPPRVIGGGPGAAPSNAMMSMGGLVLAE